MTLPFFYEKIESLIKHSATHNPLFFHIFSFILQAFIYSVKTMIPLLSLNHVPPWIRYIQKVSGLFPPQTNQPPAEEEEDAEVEETEELGHVDTYAEYKPSKCMSASSLSYALLHFV